MLLDALAVIDSSECRASTLVNGGSSRRVGLPDDHPKHGNRCGNVTWTAVLMDCSDSSHIGIALARPWRMN